MKLKVMRTAKELRPTTVVTFMSQRREAVEEAYAGDIIGFTTHGGVQLGDTITDGAVNLQFTGLPFFAPEMFMTVVLKNPLRTKQLQQGLAQLGEEGAIQVFKPEMGGNMLLGAVGQLQFEVVQHRLKGEYDADIRLEGCQYTGARWITADTPTSCKSSCNAYPQRMALRRRRHAGLPVHQPLRRAAGARAVSQDPLPPAARARGAGLAKRGVTNSTACSPGGQQAVGRVLEVAYHATDPHRAAGSKSPGWFRPQGSYQEGWLHRRQLLPVAHTSYHRRLHWHRHGQPKSAGPACPSGSW